MFEAADHSMSSLLPYDDQNSFPTFVNRIVTTLAQFLSHPFNSLLLISNPITTNNGMSYLIAITWPLHALSEIFKYFVSHSNWLMNHYHLYLKENNSSLWWTIFSIIFFPVGTWLGFWVANFIAHFMLWVWRALENNLGMDQTARANSFSIVFMKVVSLPISIFYAFTPIAQNCPKLAASLSLFLSLTGIIYSGTAYARAHCTAIWRGIGACLTLPLVIILIAFFCFKVSIIKYYPI